MPTCQRAHVPRRSVVCDEQPATAYPRRLRAAAPLVPPREGKETPAASRTGFVYGASFAQGGKARVEVYIDQGDADVNKVAFDALAADKAATESQFGEPLTWERIDEKRASRVAVYRPGTIMDEPAALADIREWMIDRLLKMKQVFGPRRAHVMQQ